MLIWGSQGKMAVVGQGPAQHCPTCEKDRTFLTYLTYKVHHIWYLIRWISGKQYTLGCEVCGRGVPLSAAEVEPQLAQSPFSWFDRFSWTIGIGLIALVMVIGFFADRQNQAENVDYLASPRQGDLYVMDMAVGATNPERPHMYTLARVKSVEPTTVTLELAANYYDRQKGVDRDISSAAYGNAGYFSPETGQIDKVNLVTMKRDGAIIDVERVN